jgi:glycerol-3-phosphate cytidylyltransferase
MIKGITFSTFDMLHTGHIAMLEEAKQNCDYLIVGLQTDPTINRPEKNKPIQTTFERYIQLTGCKYVDEIIPYDTEEDLINMLMIVKPDIRIIGQEYLGKNFTGKDLGIKLYYNSRQHDYSSSSLRKRL